MSNTSILALFENSHSQAKKVLNHYQWRNVVKMAFLISNLWAIECSRLANSPLAARDISPAASPRSPPRARDIARESRPRNVPSAGRGARTDGCIRGRASSLVLLPVKLFLPARLVPLGGLRGMDKTRSWK